MAWTWWRRSDSSGRKQGPLSWWWVLLYAIAAVAIGAAVTWWAWPPALKSPTELTKAEVEAIRTGLAAAGGAGAVFTLLLAVRRQRSTEEMDAATRHDAEQRRMTELYTAAVEQLGHDSAAVRLGALYALQRLGQDHPEQRRPIVNVWCAYLRMPFHEPDARSLDEHERAERRQELEVRLTVQRLLREHVHSGSHENESASPRFWGDELDVDLTGATLYGLDLGGCRIHPRTVFDDVTFTGDASFKDATFTGDASFANVTFTGNTVFDEATFTGDASFANATFTGDASFGIVTFTGNTVLANVTFTGNTVFDEATFTGDASFKDATFTGDASFANVTFTGDARFTNATFVSYASFKDATFTGKARLFRATARYSRKHVWPAGWELFPAALGDVFKGEDPDVPWGQLIKVSAEFGAGPDKPTTDAAEAPQT